MFYSQLFPKCKHGLENGQKRPCISYKCKYLLLCKNRVSFLSQVLPNL